MRLPLVCAVDPVNGTGRVGGQTFAAGAPVLATRGPAWSTAANFQGIWGFAAGSYFTAPNSYITQELAPGVNYDVRITYNGMTTRRTDVPASVCATTTWNLNFVGDALPTQSIVRRGDGRAVIFTRGASNDLVYSTQDSTQPDGWSAWTSLGGSLLGNPAAVVQTDGRVLVAARTSGGVPQYLEEVDAAGTWGSWTALPGLSVASDLALVKDNTNLPEVFVRGGNSRLYRSERDAAGAWGPWADLGGKIATEPAVLKRADGRLEVFAVQAPSGAANDPNADRGPLVQLAQASAGGAWGSWTDRGGSLTVTPTVAVNPDGSTEIFSRWTNGRLYHTKRSTGGSWGGWKALGGNTTIRQGVAVAVRSDGRLEVFGRANDDRLYHLTNNAANSGNFGSWSLVTPSSIQDGVSTYLASAPALGVTSNGQFVVQIRTATGHLCRTSTDGQTWSAWACNS
jgi:hypothetical protein